MNATFLLVTKIKNIRMCNVHELFWCFSVTVPTIYCFHPKFRIFLCEIGYCCTRKRCAQVSPSSYYRFTFLCLSFGHLVQNKYYEYQFTKLALRKDPMVSRFLYGFWLQASELRRNGNMQEWQYTSGYGIENHELRWFQNLRVDVNLLFMAAHSLHLSR